MRWCCRSFRLYSVSSGISTWRENRQRRCDLLVGNIEDRDTAVPNETASAAFFVSSIEASGFSSEIDHTGTYSCEWEYTTSNGYTFADASEGTMIEMHNLHSISDADKRNYQITNETRLSTDGISYVHSDADEFSNNNPSLVEVENN